MKYFVCILIFFSNACQEKLVCDRKLFVDPFIRIVDTFSYKTLTLRPTSPNDTFNHLKLKNQNLHLEIGISDSLDSLGKWASIVMRIKTFAKEENDTVLVKVLEGYSISRGCDSKQVNLSKLFPAKIDHYNIVSKNEEISIGGIRVGTVSFSEYFQSADLLYYAYFVTISSGIKSGIEKLVILTKKNNRFLIIKEIEVAVW